MDDTRAILSAIEIGVGLIVIAIHLWWLWKDGKRR
jgi:hypothetical protein